MQVSDLLDEYGLTYCHYGPLQEKNVLRKTVDCVESLNAEDVIKEYLGYGKRLAPHVVECTQTIHQAARDRKNILFEGAQGTLLDLDHGTYP